MKEMNIFERNVGGRRYRGDEQAGRRGDLYGDAAGIGQPGGAGAGGGRSGTGMKTRWEILTVDDEEVMCESLAAWLREDGYVVDTASSGREAIEQAAAKDYAIYFIDLKMPGGMDGIETMMEIA